MEWKAGSKYPPCYFEDHLDLLQKIAQDLIIEDSTGKKKFPGVKDLYSLWKCSEKVVEMAQRKINAKYSADHLEDIMTGAVPTGNLRDFAHRIKNCLAKYAAFLLKVI